MPEIPNRYGQKATQMHERRVRMLVKVDSLGLPQIVKERLIAIAGQRYDPATGKIIVTSDSKVIFTCSNQSEWLTCLPHRHPLSRIPAT